MPARMTEAQLRGLGVLPPSKPKKRGMNKWEREYADYLEGERRYGNVLWWAWEAIKLRLADRTWYTPDFPVLLGPAPELEFHEVKGFMRDDAAVKIKVAAELYPWRFVIVRKTKGGWTYEEVPGRRQ